MSVAIVSGAAGSLGRAFVGRLLDAGHRVLAFDVREDVKNIDGAHNMIADVRSHDDVARVVRRAAELGEIEVVVNNAAVWHHTPVTADWDKAVADWATVMDVNLKGVLLLSRAAVPLLREAGGGCIVNVSSDCVLPARNNSSNHPEADLFSASKWALNGLTDAWARALKDDKIRVVGLCLDRVASPMLEEMARDIGLPAEDPILPGQAADFLLEIVASGRSGENFGGWAGETLAVGERAPAHRRITG